MFENPSCTRRQAIRQLGGLGAALAAPTVVPSTALGADGATAPGSDWESSASTG